jgi:GMP synthase-like glutamine amidotransferase
MRIHSLQHVWFEGLANLDPWAASRGHELSKTLCFQDARFPPVDELDVLIVMGGPMSVHDENHYPWLKPETNFLEQAISKDKSVVGICLGAQLLAHLFGARVYKNRYKEIGWHRVSLTDEARTSKIFGNLPREFEPFHWHGETFDLPRGCLRTAGNAACLNQAFEYDGGRVIGLQFHLESSLDSIRLLIDNCSSDLTPGDYVQNPEQMLAAPHRLTAIAAVMVRLMDAIEGRLMLPAGAKC